MQLLLLREKSRCSYQRQLWCYGLLIGLTVPVMTPPSQPAPGAGVVDFRVAWEFGLPAPHPELLNHKPELLITVAFESSASGLEHSRRVPGQGFAVSHSSLHRQNPEAPWNTNILLTADSKDIKSYTNKRIHQRVTGRVLFLMQMELGRDERSEV